MSAGQIWLAYQPVRGRKRRAEPVLCAGRHKSGSETGVQHQAEELRLRPGPEPPAGQRPRRKLGRKLAAEDNAVAFRLLRVRMDEIKPLVSRKARDQVEEYAKMADI